MTDKKKKRKLPCRNITNRACNVVISRYSIPAGPDSGEEEVEGTLKGMGPLNDLACLYICKAELIIDHHCL